MMDIYINILPYMKDVKALKELLDQWQGGIEIVTEGYQWGDHPLDWEREVDRFKDYPGNLSVHTPIFELNLASYRYKVISEYSFEVYKQSIQWSAKIGAKHVVIHPNLQTTPIYNREAAQELSKTYLRKLGELGRSDGISVLIENVGFHDCMLFDEEEFVHLFEEIPEIDALLDVGHSHINGWNTSEVIRRLGDRLAAVHLHDNDGARDLHQPIGEGTIEWTAVWDALRSLENNVNMTLEYQIGTPTDTLMNHARIVQLEMSKEGSL